MSGIGGYNLNKWASENFELDNLRKQFGDQPEPQISQNVEIQIPPVIDARDHQALNWIVQQLKEQKKSPTLNHDMLQKLKSAVAKFSDKVPSDKHVKGLGRLFPQTIAANPKNKALAKIDALDWAVLFKRVSSTPRSLTVAERDEFIFMIPSMLPHLSKDDRMKLIIALSHPIFITQLTSVDSESKRNALTELCKQAIKYGQLYRLFGQVDISKNDAVKTIVTAVMRSELAMPKFTWRSIASKFTPITAQVSIAHDPKSRARCNDATKEALDTTIASVLSNRIQARIGYDKQTLELINPDIRKEVGTLISDKIVQKLQTGRDATISFSIPKQMSEATLASHRDEILQKAAKIKQVLHYAQHKDWVVSEETKGKYVGQTTKVEKLLEPVGADHSSELADFYVTSNLRVWSQDSKAAEADILKEQHAKLQQSYQLLKPLLPSYNEFSVISGIGSDVHQYAHYTIVGLLSAPPSIQTLEPLEKILDEAANTTYQSYFQAFQTELADLNMAITPAQEEEISKLSGNKKMSKQHEVLLNNITNSLSSKSLSEIADIYAAKPHLAKFVQRYLSEDILTKVKSQDPTKFAVELSVNPRLLQLVEQTNPEFLKTVKVLTPAIIEQVLDEFSAHEYNIQWDFKDEIKLLQNDATAKNRKLDILQNFIRKLAEFFEASKANPERFQSLPDNCPAAYSLVRFFNIKATVITGRLLMETFKSKMQAQAASLGAESARISVKDEEDAAFKKRVENVIQNKARCKDHLDLLRDLVRDLRNSESDYGDKPLKPELGQLFDELQKRIEEIDRSREKGAPIDFEMLNVVYNPITDFILSKKIELDNEHFVAYTVFNSTVWDFLIRFRPEILKGTSLEKK